MVVINALVYHSKEDKCYIAEGYEIAQEGTGKTIEKAENDLLTAIKNTKDLVKKKKDLAFLDAKNASNRCERGLEKIALIGMNYMPHIKKIEDIEVHFYQEI